MKRYIMIPEEYGHRMVEDPNGAWAWCDLEGDWVPYREAISSAEIERSEELDWPGAYQPDWL